MVEDSRCPINARCVWAGRLIVRADVLGSGGIESRDFELGQPQPVAGGTITLAGPVRTGGKLIFGPINPATPYTIDGGNTAGGETLTTVGGITANSSATIAATIARSRWVRRAAVSASTSAGIRIRGSRRVRRVSGTP